MTYGPSSRPEARGSGVTAYDLSGRRLYHLYPNRVFGQVELAGDYGHVLLGPPRTKRLVFDARNGKALGMLPALTKRIEILGPPPPRASATRALSSNDDPFARVSNRGVRVQPKAERPGEREHTPRDVFLLRRDQGRAVYRIGGLRPGYTACYASGRADDVGRLGLISCGRSPFPSRAQPLFELSTFELRRGTEQPRVLRLEGIAADAVAEVGVTDADGNVIARVPVVDNVYLLTSPPVRAAPGVVAFDRAGEIVFRSDRRRQAPPPPTKTRLVGFRIKLALPRGWAGEIQRAGPGRALVLAGNRLPARNVRSVSFALHERDPRSRPAFRRITAPPRLTAHDVRSVGRFGRAERSFTLKGRQFTLQVAFGTPKPARVVLADVNRLLASLEVGAIAVPPTVTPAHALLQRGRADGVSVDVYRAVVVFRLEPTSRAYRLGRGKRVGVACLTFDSVDPWETNHWGASKPIAPTLQFVLSEGAGPERPYATLDPVTEARPPFDGCLVSGSYGRRWNDPRGQHSPAEIPFTARGARFFDEQAVARDLAQFVRSPILAESRRAQKRGGAAPTAAALVSRLPSRVVALPSRTAVPAYGAIGVWSDGREVVEAVARSRAGKRLYVTIRAGKIARHNLEGLAFVF